MQTGQPCGFCIRGYVTPSTRDRGAVRYAAGVLLRRTLGVVSVNY